MCTAKLTIKYTAGGFDKLDLKEKAEYVMQLKQIESDLKDAISEVKDIFEEDLGDSRNSFSEAIQITTSYGVVELPSGYKEKSLKDAEVVAFAQGLKELDSKAYNTVVSMVPKLNKVEINRLRKEVGDMKVFIDKAFSTEEPKPAVYILNKTI